MNDLNIDNRASPLTMTAWTDRLKYSLQSANSTYRLSILRVFSSTTIPMHQFFGTQTSLWSNSHICAWLLEKTVLTIRTFVSKVMSLLCKMLSRFVIAFLPRSKCLLISRLQSLSTLILEPNKIKSVIASTFPLLFPPFMKWWNWIPWS